MDNLLEIGKTLGSIAGLCSAIFLLMDRWTKHYPVTFIEARPLLEGGAHIVSFLILKNVSERPILVSWQEGRTDQFIIAKDHSPEGMFRHLHEGETTIALAPQQEAVLPLLKPRTYPEIDAENMIETELRWQLAQPLLWQLPRRLTVSIKKRAFEALIEGYRPPEKG